jgi:hypothetical protein
MKAAAVFAVVDALLTGRLRHARSKGTEALIKRDHSRAGTLLVMFGDLGHDLPEAAGGENAQPFHRGCTITDRMQSGSSYSDNRLFTG